MELKRECPAPAGMVAEAVLKLLRLPEWKVMVDCRDMVHEGGWQGSPEVGVKGWRRQAAVGPLGFMGLQKGRDMAMKGPR